MGSIWKRALVLGAALSLSGALAAACGSSGGGNGGNGGNAPGGAGGASCSGDLASIDATIFKPTCAAAGCHTGGTNAAGSLDLSGDAATALVNVPSATCPQEVLVVPGAPSQSFLYSKLVDAQPKCGSPMPLGKSLTDAQKACIEAWISGLPPTGGNDAGSDGPGCETCGGASCVDLMTDAQHCGSCTNACAAGATCEAGSCKCPGTEQLCGSACADLTTDPNNCGTCGHACTAGQMCAAGKCSSGCGSLPQCGTTCCAAGASCSGGQCVCPSGTSACNGACINTTTDPQNCGACGHVCSGGACAGGVCGCAGGGTMCNGACVDTQTDTNNCGACGHVCAVGQTCSGGSCACGSASVSFSGAVQPIFTSKCANAGCHSGPAPAQQLSLVSGQSYGKLVNVAATECSDGRKRVLPGQPADSYLIEKLMGVSLCFGTQMPKTGSIASADIQTISNWICAGAPNN